MKARMRLRLGCLVASFAILTGVSVQTPSHAQSIVGVQDAPTDSHEKYREIINANTITVMGSVLTGSHIKLVDDIAKAVNDGHNLRMLPLLGEGGAQNIRDILYLRGVDAGIVRLNSADIYEKEPLFTNLRNRLQYITILIGEEIHVVSTPEINSIQDLVGKKVGIHSGSFVQIQDLLNRLKIKAASVVNLDFWDGMEKVKTKELDVVFRITASPMKGLDERFDPKVHKMISIPFDGAITDGYMPGAITHKMYPKVVPEGEVIETAATAIVLAAYAWQPGTERYRRVAKFTEAFFSSMPKLLADKERHPGWDSVNLNSELKGWKRFPAAQEWLDKHKGETNRANTASVTSTAGQENTQNLRAELLSFLEKQGTGPVPSEKMDEVFGKFLEWRQQRKPAVTR